MAADLHCHTKMSDGTVSIEELVLLAKKRGLSAVAVTDHDTFAGAGRAVIYGKRKGIEVVPGAEFSTLDGKTGRKVHILCYFCPHPDRLLGLCRDIAQARKRAVLIMLHKVLKLYPVPVDMVMHRAQGSTNIFKQHIMHALMDAGYADSIYGEIYHHLFDPEEGVAYLPVHYPETRDVIRQIHEAGGVAVLAHPAEYDSYDILLELSASRVIDGIEISHPRTKPEDVKGFCALAKQYGLAMTGGSDFHGMYSRQMNPVGSYQTEDDQLQLLREKVKNY
ncbi:MAG: PHP domain-containing protein [Oscillospiraceae bacterium]|nr:PHP domain-containing protein [Oscillospiraceae bacterium]